MNFFCVFFVFDFYDTGHKAIEKAFAVSRITAVYSEYSLRAAANFAYTVIHFNFLLHLFSNFYFQRVNGCHSDWVNIRSGVSSWTIVIC